MYSRPSRRGRNITTKFSSKKGDVSSLIYACSITSVTRLYWSNLPRLATSLTGRPAAASPPGNYPPQHLLGLYLAGFDALTLNHYNIINMNNRYIKTLKISGKLQLLIPRLAYGNSKWLWEGREGGMKTATSLILSVQ